jgi:hypothetical protein
VCHADAGRGEEGAKNFLRSNIPSLGLDPLRWGEAYARGLKHVLEGLQLFMKHLLSL